MLSPGEYEQLVRDVCQSLVNQSQVRNVTVEHDVVLTGKSGATHQIDVYWEFRIGEIVYRTCIECKNYRDTVEKSHIATFAGILSDLTNTTGVFVTTQGYQSGAKLYAEAMGIRLLLVKSLLRKVTVALNVYLPEVVTVGIDLRCAENKALMKAAGVEAISNESVGKAIDVVFVDKEGQPAGTMSEVLRVGPVDAGEHFIGVSGKYLAHAIGLLKVVGVSYSLIHHHASTEIQVGGEHVARAVVEDVVANTTAYLHEDGSLQDGPMDKSKVRGLTNSGGAGAGAG